MYFTHMVWKNVQRIGFGYATNGNQFWVTARCKPEGNIFCQYPENVARPLNGEIEAMCAPSLAPN